MSSVNPIQPGDLHMQKAKAGNPAQSGDPFEALLESAAATRRAKPDARGRQPARQEPMAPRPRAEARSEALKRSDVAGAPPQTAKADLEPQATDGAANAAPSGGEQQQVESQTVAAQNSDTGEEDAAFQQDGETAVQANTTTADGNPEAEAPVAISADGETLDHETAGDDSGTPDSAPVETAQVPAATEADAGSDPLAVATAEAPADDAHESAPANAAQPVQAVPGATADAKPEAAGAPVATTDKAAPAPAAPAAEPDAPETPAIQPALQRAAASSADQPQSQPAQQPGFAAALPDEGVMPSFDDAGEQQFPQRPNVPQAAAAKPGLDVKPEQFADAAKPAPETASLKAELDALPEPLRALASTLNTPSANAIHFRAAAPNERVPVPLNPAALAAEIVSRARDGMQRFEIRLDPPELGRIDVRLEVDRAGNVKTRLTVDRPETLDLMQRDARGLERALQHAGLKTDSGGLEFSLRSHAEGGAHEGHAERHGRERNLMPDEGGERIEAVIDGYRSAAFARGGVDIRI